LSFHLTFLIFLFYFLISFCWKEISIKTFNEFIKDWTRSTVLKRALIRPSSIIPETEALVKFYFFHLINEFSWKCQKMMCSEQHCHRLFKTLLVLWNQNFFIKRCAFRRSTKPCKVYLGLLKNNCIVREKKSKKHHVKNTKKWLITHVLMDFYFFGSYNDIWKMVYFNCIIF
jgi:hypothetical protein